MSKKVKWGLGFTLALTLIVGCLYCYTRGQTETELYTMCATCMGSSNCHACKNCKYCRHCAKNGGSCGVCR